MREPETLKELLDEIARQNALSETVTITLTEGDGIHELMEDMQKAIDSQRGKEHAQSVAHQYAETVREQDAIIKSLCERIAHLEEANAGMCETRIITEEEWKEEFK